LAKGLSLLVSSTMACLTKVTPLYYQYVVLSNNQLVKICWDYIEDISTLDSAEDDPHGDLVSEQRKLFCLLTPYERADFVRTLGELLTAA
jgi:hypothetical protein